MKIDDFIKKRRLNKGELDVLLIHTATFYDLDSNYMNMGLLYMATLLTQKGYKARCISAPELMQTTREKMEKSFKKANPGIVGFYTISDNIYSVGKLAKEIKNWLPDATIVAGGPLAASLGKKILERPDFDVCVTGEGENTIIQLADVLIKKKGEMDAVRGIIYRRGGELVTTPPAEPVTDLDCLPFPDYNLADIRYGFHVVSGRGCPYNCIFCYQGVHGGRYRFRSVENVVKEAIAILERYNLTFFDIIDDTFISNPKRVMKFCKAMSNYRKITGRDFVFFCQGRIDIMDRHPEMLPALKEAGAARIQVGLESGHPKILKAFNKKITVEQMKRVAKQFSDVGGMGMIGNFILGGPGESEDTFETTLALAKELTDIAPGLFESKMCYLAPYPGTPIAVNPGKFGLKILDEDFEGGFSGMDVHMETDALDKTKLRKLRERFYFEMDKKMRQSIRNVPEETLKMHFRWAWKYGINSMWYGTYLAGREALANFFHFHSNPRYSRFKSIPEDEFMEWIPQRTSPGIVFVDDGGRVELPETTDVYFLKDPDEIFIYKMSAGKLNIGEIVDRFIEERRPGATRTEVLENVAMPFYDRMEALYQVVFYR